MGSLTPPGAPCRPSNRLGPECCSRATQDTVVAYAVVWAPHGSKVVRFCEGAPPTPGRPNPPIPRPSTRPVCGASLSGPTRTSTRADRAGACMGGLDTCASSYGSRGHIESLLESLAIRLTGMCEGAACLFCWVAGPSMGGLSLALWVRASRHCRSV